MNHQLVVEFGRCPDCGLAVFPIHALSPCGHMATLERRPFTETGLVYAWSRVHTSQGPQPMAMADFMDGQLRVTAPVLGASSVGVGDAVRVRSGVDTPYALELVLPES